MSLSSLGWDDFFVRAFQPFAAAGLVPARVAVQHKHAYELLSAGGSIAATCTGRLLHLAAGPGDLPAVGDWVAVLSRAGEAQVDIHAVLPRRTKFSRRASGDPDLEQVVAANVDTVLLITALDQNFNLRRIERYLAGAWESGAQPVVVLNKADLHPDPAAARAEAIAVAGGAPVVVLSALAAAPGAPPPPPSDSAPNSVTRVTGFGKGEVELALAPWLVPGRTLALLGSSGVGKSTLINRLIGEERQRTEAISDAMGKGRHTTTYRELLVTPSGALVIDTPGMRELQFWEVDETALAATFSDVDAIAARCRFGDCAHRTEPGCAIQAALADGTLAPGRWRSYQKLQREQAYAARRADPRLERANRDAWKKIHKAQRALFRRQHDD